MNPSWTVIKQLIKLPEGKLLVACCLIAIAFLATGWAHSGIISERKSMQLIKAATACGAAQAALAASVAKEKAELITYYETQIATERQASMDYVRQRLDVKEKALDAALAESQRVITVQSRIRHNVQRIKSQITKP